MTSPFQKALEEMEEARKKANLHHLEKINPRDFDRPDYWNVHECDALALTMNNIDRLIKAAKRQDEALRAISRFRFNEMMTEEGGMALEARIDVDKLFESSEG